MKRVITIILAILCIAMSGFLVYEKVIKTDLIKGEKSQTEPITVTDKDVIEAYQKLHYSLDSSIRSNHDDYFKNKQVGVEDIPNLVAFKAVVGMLSSQKEDITSIGKERFSKALATLYGKNYLFIYQTYETCPGYVWDQEKESYIYIGAECASTGVISLDKVMSAKKTKNELILEVRVIFASKNNLSTPEVLLPLSYYKDYKRQVALTDLTIVDGKVIDSDDNYRKGSLYKVIFTLEDGAYVFTSSEPLN